MRVETNYLARMSWGKGRLERNVSDPALIMNRGNVIVYPFFSHKKRGATVRISKARLQKTAVSMPKFNVAQEANIFYFVEEPEPDLRQASGAHTAAAMVRIDIHSFEIRHVVGLGDDIHLEQ